MCVCLMMFFVFKLCGELYDVELFNFCFYYIDDVFNFDMLGDLMIFNVMICLIDSMCKEIKGLVFDVLLCVNDLLVELGFLFCFYKGIDLLGWSIEEFGGE